ncbi:Zn-ribbon domain-containing OB-fold protein [Rhodococcus olei]|uniref:Zn-ribbon domain-containing OB-fold protein n=1 Tax=Rhodococcus olei TaxID=2161675 RepID=UPI0031E81CB1
MFEDPRPPIDGALMIRRCEACTILLAPDTSACPDCGDTSLTWVPSCGVGSIVSCTVVDCAPHPGACTGFIPCTIAIVELDDGPWTYAWIEGQPPDRGAEPVRVRFAHEEPGERYPFFVRCAA